MAKNLTAKQTLEKLKAERTISTGMLKALNLPFEAWLRYCQVSEDIAQKAVDMAIAKLEKEQLAETGK
jgi:hypothetical protein